MIKYSAVFFDLDHTLWDFETNSCEAISEIFHIHNLDRMGVPGTLEFMTVYREVNRSMWGEYHRNLISKETLRSGRFRHTLETFGIRDAHLSEMMAAEYLEACPVKTNLFPGTMETLTYLSAKYSLHIITNGFKEVQHLKIKNSGLEPFFDHIHISEEIGFKKPEPEIFHHAVKKAGIFHQQCIMIGDNPETDMAGAAGVGIDTIFFNPLREITEHKFTHEITHLNQLQGIL